MNRPTTTFDHRSPTLRPVRDELLGKLRQESPVAWTDAHGGYWVVTSYDLVRRVITDDVNFTTEYIPNARGGITIPETDRPRIIPGETDGSEHARYRRAIAGTLSRSAINDQRDELAALVTDVTTSLVERNEFDAVRDFAMAIPIAVVLRYLRLDVDDPYEYFKAAELTVGIKEEGEDLTEAEVQVAVASVWDTLSAAVEEKRARPDDGVISMLAHQDPPLTDLEIRDMMASVVLGGARTSAALIENIVWELEIDRDARAAISADRSVIPRAVEEYLRYFSPSQMVARTVAADVELGGVRLRKGDRLIVSWHSANHDELVYGEPEEIRFDRRAKPHLAFGAGPHFCVGSWLAKAEAELALDALLTLMPDYALDRPRCRRVADMLIDQWAVMPAFASGKPSQPTDR
jgi:cytochrome P450